MSQSFRHPLDKLINDNSLLFLEAMVPFVDMKMKRLLIIYIKYKELTILLNNLNDGGLIEKCGFNCTPNSTEDVINSLCTVMPEDFSSSIGNTMQMLNMMQAMNGLSPGGATQGCKANDSTENQSMYNNIMNILNGVDNEDRR